MGTFFELEHPFPVAGNAEFKVLSVPRFNPSLGVLTKVDVSVQGRNGEHSFYFQYSGSEEVPVYFNGRFFLFDENSTISPLIEFDDERMKTVTPAFPVFDGSAEKVEQTFFDSFTGSEMNQFIGSSGTVDVQFGMSISARNMPYPLFEGSASGYYECTLGIKYYYSPLVPEPSLGAFVILALPLLSRRVPHNRRSLASARTTL